MATKLMKELAAHEGYCCVYALFRANVKVRTGVFARRYGVSRQTIRYWRNKLKHKQLSCEERMTEPLCIVATAVTLGLSPARAFD